MRIRVFLKNTLNTLFGALIMIPLISISTTAASIHEPVLSKTINLKKFFSKELVSILSYPLSCNGAGYLEYRDLSRYEKNMCFKKSPWESLFPNDELDLLKRGGHI